MTACLHPKSSRFRRQKMWGNKLPMMPSATRFRGSRSEGRMNCLERRAEGVRCCYEKAPLKRWQCWEDTSSGEAPVHMLPAWKTRTGFQKCIDWKVEESVILQERVKEGAASGSWKAAEAAKHRSQEPCVALTPQALLSMFGWSVMFMWPLWTVAHQALSPWDFLGKNTRMGCHFFLQGIFLTQGLNPCLLHYRQILYSWATREAQPYK